MLLPSAIKVGHVFENHKHEVCIDNSTTHLHTLDLDCEFYKFKIGNQTYPILENHEFYILEPTQQLTVNSYNFLSQFQRLHFSLRGPPVNS